MFPFFFFLLYLFYRRTALEGCVGVHQPDGPGKNLMLSV
jgi:hypothetical protein